ncbi:hypothetical protein [Fusobacterium sp. MFO224]|uniref:hypothetical protein n=1 Tax=Fusobacterium sp. MFO224 TaxID=3378070 RepID=UPI003851B05F
MYFLKDKKKKGSILVLTIFLLFFLTWSLVITSFILNKEYEKCYFLIKNKKVDNDIILIGKKYEQYINENGGVKYIIYKNKQIIWSKNIKNIEDSITNNGYRIEKILKNNIIIYDLKLNKKNNYLSLINNYSDYGKKNIIKIIFLKHYINGSIGKKNLKNITIRVIIESSYYYDKDLDITKNLKSEIEEIYVEKQK